MRALDPPEQLAHLGRLRLAMARHHLRAWRREPLFKQSVLPVIFALLWFGWYAGCARAFRYLLLLPGIGPILVDRLTALMLAAVFGMLIASTIVTALTTLYHSRDVNALLAYPVSHASLFILKAAEVGLIAAWAPLFFLGPVLLAYGLTLRLAWPYYLAAGAAVPWFLALACLLGLWLVLLAARWCPHLRGERWRVLLPAAAMLWLIWLVRRLPHGNEVTAPQVGAIANQLFRHTTFIRWPLNPAYWLSEGLQAVMQGRWSRAIGFGAVLSSTTLLAAQVTLACARRQYYAGWSRLSSWPTIRRTARRPARIAWRIRWPGRTPPQWLILVKDARLFARDPAQWSHVVIFFGMLAVYILNLRTLPYDLRNPFWQHLIAFLNLAATTLTMAMLNVRCVFPQLSLEGRRAWIMRLAPISWSQVLQAKWWTGLLGSLAVTELLVVGSGVMLRLTPAMLALACAMSLVMCCAIVGLSVGLGARYPDFTQENPARIIAGFGGTLLLVLTLAYVAAMMALGAAPLHWWVSGALRMSPRLRRVAWAIGLAAAAVSCLTAVTPWRAGVRQAQRQEFA